MIDYLIKLDYILGYQRFKRQGNPLKPEDTCQLLMSVKFTNLIILSAYFIVGLLRHFDILGNKIITFVWVGISIVAILWFNFKIKERIYQSPIRKKIKNISEEEKRKCVKLSYIYSLGSTLLWILAFTWPVILHGTAVMVTPK